MDSRFIELNSHQVAAAACLLSFLADKLALHKLYPSLPYTPNPKPQTLILSP